MEMEIVDFYLKTDVYAIIERMILLKQAQVAEKQELEILEARLKKERNFIDIKTDLCNWLDYLHKQEVERTI